MDEKISVLKRGFAGGLAAFFAGVVLTYPLAFVTAATQFYVETPQSLLDADVAVMSAIIYSGAHVLHFDGVLFPLAQDDILGPTALYYLLPVLTLTAAGYWSASRSSTNSLSRSALEGALVVWGYAAAVVGFFAFLYLTGGSPPDPYTLPQFVFAVGVLAILYAQVFGGVGGSLAYLSSRLADRPPVNHGQRGHSTRLKLGFSTGVAGFLLGATVSYPVIYLSKVFGGVSHRIDGFWDTSIAASSLIGYCFAHFVYLEDTFALLPIAGHWFGGVLYLLPVLLLSAIGYLVARKRTPGSYLSHTLDGVFIGLGYLTVPTAFIALAGLYARNSPPQSAPSESLFEMAAIVGVPMFVYAIVFGGLAGASLARYLRSGSDLSGIRYEFEIRHLLLAVLAVSAVLAAGLYVPTVIDEMDTMSGPHEKTCQERLKEADLGGEPVGDVEAHQLNGAPRAGVSLNLDQTNRSLDVAVVTMGRVDYILLVGDHGFDGNPALCATGESATLQERHLQESGSITAIAVIGDVELYEERGMPVGEAEGDAVETALQTEKWDFRSTR